MARNINDNEQKKQFVADVYGTSQQFGWKAPLKLINEGVKAALNRDASGTLPNFGIVESDISSRNTVCMVPYIKNVYRNGAWFSGVSTEYLRAGDSWYAQVRASIGGGTVEFLGSSTLTAPDNLDMMKKSDVALWLSSIKTVREARESLGTTWHTVEPIAAWGAGEFKKDITKQGQSAIVYAPMDVDAVMVKASATGDFGENRNGTITFTAEDCNEYDDWFVIDASQFYNRPKGSKNAREIVKQDANDFYPLPAVMYKINSLGAMIEMDRTSRNPDPLAFKPQTWSTREYVRQKGIYAKVVMPNFGNVNGKVMRQWENGYPYGSRAFYDFRKQKWDGFVGGYDTKNAIDAMWLRGFHNKLVPLLGDETTAAMVGHAYKLTYSIGSQSVSWTGWITPAENEKLSDSVLKSTYGAVQLCNVNKNVSAIRGTQVNTNPFIGVAHNTPLSAGVYADIGQFYGNTGKTFMAFPTKEAIIQFFADWGILASEDYNEVTLAENPNGDENPPPGGDDFGPWNPDGTPGDDWENPTPGGDGKPIVDYDPDDKGDKPIGDDVLYLSTAAGSNSYVLTYPGVVAIQNWMLGTEFLNDASNLFLNKMSAINSLTLFPFDLFKHDANSLTGTKIIEIAGAALAYPAGTYLIAPSYNNLVHGGHITFGTDWKSIHGTYRAFSNASYSVYIPFVGLVQVPASAVIYRTLSLDYAVDAISGQATAILTSYGESDNGYIVTMCNCQMGLCVPLYSDNYTQRSWAITTAAISGAINGATGNFSSQGQQMGQKMMAGKPAQYGESGLMTTKAVPASGGMAAAGVAVGVGSMAIGAFVGGAKGAIESAMANPIEFSHTGSVSPMNSWRVGLKAQLIVTEQVPAIPNDYQWVMGQPTAQRGYLYKFANNGYNYVECYATKVSVSGATLDEVRMIEEHLQRGVFI